MLSESRYPNLPEWLRELYPFRTRTHTIDGHAMSFVDEGPAEAPVFLLLHGNPTWSFLYRNLIRRLRDQYRVIVPDMIGFGLSDKPNDAAYHTLGRHIGNLKGLVDALALADVTIVTNGWGGPVGLGYAVAHPENVTRLILTNTWVCNLPERKGLRPPLGARIASSGRLGAWLDSWLNLAMHSTFASRTHRTLQDMALEAYTYPFRAAACRTGPNALSRMFFHPDRETLATLSSIESGLKKVQATATIIWGVEDPLLSKLPAYLLRDALKGAGEPVFLPDVGHYVPEEAPDELAELVLRQPESREKALSESVFRIIG